MIGNRKHMSYPRDIFICILFSIAVGLLFIGYVSLLDRIDDTENVIIQNCNVAHDNRP